MLKLFVQHADQTNSVIPVRWCVPKVFIDEIKEKKMRPYLLLSVLHHRQRGAEKSRREVARKLVPLEQSMEYIQFQRSGLHTLHAVVVAQKYHEDRWMIDCLLSECCGDFRQELFSHLGKFWKEDLEQRNILCLCEPAELDVQVNEKFFAPEPSARESWWVNLWFESPPRDQCNFRRRRLLAYTVQAAVVGLWIPIISIVRLGYALFLFLGGTRKVNFRAVIHPFYYETKEVCGYSTFPENNVFLTDKERGKKNRLWLVIHPFLWILLGIIGFLIYHFHIWEWVKVFVPAGVCALIVCYLLGKLLPDKKTTAERRRRREEERQYSALDDIFCTGTPLEASVSALPRSRRTIYLRFQEIKARVCRPYSRD